MKNWTVSQKLVFLCGCFLLNIILVQSVGQWTSSKLRHHIEKFGEVELPAIRNMTLADMMHDGLLATAYRALYVARTQNKEGFAETRAELEARTKDFEMYLNALEALPLDNSVKQSIAAVKPDLELYKGAITKVVNLALTGKLEEAEHSMSEAQEAFEKLEASLGTLGDQIENEAQTETDVSKKDENIAFWIGWILLISSLIIGVLNGLWIIRDVSMRLKQIMGRLRDEAGLLSSTSTQMSSTSTSLSTASTRQAEALQQTASAIEEMSSMIRKTSENASESRSVAEESQKTATQGQQTVSDMISAIREINTSNEAIARQIAESNRQISEITHVINEIGNKTKVINDIVFQTKLLSFNASVEAARAGEHGKGFAVVAEEVGNLAQMSGNSAKEISDMLSSSIKKVDVIVGQSTSEIERLMTQNKSKIESGTRIAQECGRVLQNMVKSVSEVSERVFAISSATNEQSIGVQEITKAMNQLDQITHSNSTTSQEAQGAANELKTRATHLLDVVGQLEALTGTADVPPPTKTFSAERAKASDFSVELKKHGAGGPAPIHEPTKSVLKKLRSS